MARKMKFLRVQYRSEIAKSQPYFATGRSSRLVVKHCDFCVASECQCFSVPSMPKKTEPRPMRRLIWSITCTSFCSFSRLSAGRYSSNANSVCWASAASLPRMSMSRMPARLKLRFGENTWRKARIAAGTISSELSVGIGTGIWNEFQYDHGAGLSEL